MIDDVTGTLTIGDFAKATHLSVKTLRHYHDLGLLVPTQIDASSKYRRYGVDQIQSAQVIRRLRDLDMPLAAIGAVLDARDYTTRSELIAAHLARLERELVETQNAVGSLRGLLQGASGTPTITHRSEPAVQAASVSTRVARAELGAWFYGALREVEATLDAQHVLPSGPAGTIVSDAFFADDSGEITLFVPTGTRVAMAGRVEPRLIPSIEVAVIVHAGSHTGIDRTYGALAAHVANHAVAVDGPIRERYLVSGSDTDDERRWRTEIAWPIFLTAAS
jgi:DNA-binding transcriptional MerR regulator/effector-binding domain-containing protein